MSALSNQPPAEQGMSYSIRSSEHPDGQFNPFDPDPIGALREAYAFITQPLLSEVAVIDGKRYFTSQYDTSRYNELVRMMRRAINNGSAQ